MANLGAWRQVAERLGAPSEATIDELLMLIDQQCAVLQSKELSTPVESQLKAYLAQLSELQSWRKLLEADRDRSHEQANASIDAGARMATVSSAAAATVEARHHEEASSATQVGQELSPGQSLCGHRYLVERTLRRSGVGDVYLAVDRTRHEHVAVTVFSSWLVEDAQTLACLQRQGEIVAGLHHRNIQRLEATIADSRRFIQIAELLPGETLRERMTRVHGCGEHFSVADALDIAVQVAAALAYVHRKSVVHLDVKPENVLLTEDATVKLMDFQSMSVLKHPAMLQAEAGTGTPPYAAPELLSYERRVDHRADQYALGVVLLEALTGGTSTEHLSSLRGIRPETPRRLVAILERLLAKGVERRFSSTDDLHDALLACQRILRSPVRRRLGSVALYAWLLASWLLLVFAGSHWIAYGSNLEAERLAGEMIRVSAGTFEVSSDLAHRPTDLREFVLTRDFYLGRYPVTQEQFEGVMGINPSRFVECGRRCPVENVDWIDAAMFTNRLNELAGHAPCYDSEGDVIGGRTAYDCDGYRLPTAAEWEYASRAGGAHMDVLALADAGWGPHNSDGRTHEVGLKQPNDWGFHDMVGHAWEWTDSRSVQFPSGTDPVGPPTGRRVALGGSLSARETESWRRLRQARGNEGAGPWRRRHEPTQHAETESWRSAEHTGGERAQIHGFRLARTAR